MTREDTAADRSDDASTREAVAERRMELFVGRVLQGGVLCAGLIVLVGGVALLTQHGRGAVDFRTFRGAAEETTRVGYVLAGVARLDSRAIVQLGLLLLIATPVTRVALTLAAFALRRDRLYAVLSAVVLALLIAGFLWGAA
jgi:uncharacterized membrane protein